MIYKVNFLNIKPPILKSLKEDKFLLTHDLISEIKTHENLTKRITPIKSVKLNNNDDYLIPKII